MRFLRSLGGMPHSAHGWCVLAEMGRRPLQLKWLVRCARLWVRLRGQAATSLPHAALRASIEMHLRDRAGHGWVSEFLGALVQIDAVPEEAVASCTTVDDVLKLKLNVKVVEDAANYRAAAFWGSERAVQDPGQVALSSEQIVASTYKRWVMGGAVSRAPHTTALLPPRMRQMLIRLRVTGFPLSICVGRQKGVARPQRVCIACGGVHVEDLRHFLLECSALAQIRLLYPRIFGSRSDPAAILANADQVALAAVLYEMLRHRQACLAAA